MSAPQAVTAMVPAEHIDFELVRRTVFPKSTDDELKLYLHDCQRRGVHPLDRLIHPTIRTDKSGARRYTPITSIDLMRSQAEATGDYAGSDDPAHTGAPKCADFLATVTVWKMVQGQRCPFSATARWSEYKPDKDDWMWQKMPHGQLGKCAEALALRKAFPRQLSGLYAKEEMDQAGETHATPMSKAIDVAVGGDLSGAVAEYKDAWPNNGDRAKFLAATKQLGWTPAEGDAWLYRKVQKTWTKIPRPEFHAIIADIQTNGAKFDEASMVPPGMLGEGETHDADGVVDHAPKEPEAMATAEQCGKIYALGKKCGMTSREAVQMYAADQAGHPILDGAGKPSLKALTKDEALTVIERLLDLEEGDRARAAKKAQDDSDDIPF